MKRKDVAFIKKSLAKVKRIVILIHYNPDGDAIGSALALYMFLQQQGHVVDVISPNPFPQFLQWMPQSNKIMPASENIDVCISKISTAELIFCLDFNAPNRIGILQDALKAAKASKIIIDHHIDPTKDFDIYYSVSEGISSTSELMYNFLIHKLGNKKSITKAMAECLYVGIITDTGSLSYSCNNPSTYKIIGHLIAMGVDGEDIHRKVYDTYSEDRMRLLGYCLSTRLHIIDEYTTSYIFLTKEDLKTFSYQHGDTEGFVNYGLSIENIDFTAIFVEREDRIRISFRSMNDFNVNEYAKKYFKGGGHKNAAGADSFLSMEDTLTYFEKTLKECKVKK
ncbi:MAG: bifunctional oligoribonuclease/PAP phosphatase NrnA [Bacteroidales bacterium]|nr:bifunctional oligoribonuclease/PAP phosphatase NrnA [Bacteroidales bacterium]